jgi:hypothetical protein
MIFHLGVMTLFAACVAAVFAVLQRDEARAQVVYGARLFGLLAGSALVLGGLQYIFFR